MSKMEIKEMVDTIYESLKEKRKGRTTKWMENMKNEWESVILRNYKLVNLYDIDNVISMLSLDSINRIKKGIDEYLDNRIRGLSER